MQNKIFECSTSGERVDKFLLSQMNGYTRSAIKKLIDDGNVTINNSTIKAGRILSVGEKIVVNIPNPITMEAKPEDIEIDIIYQDDDIAIINKAQGMTVHQGAGNYEGTLVNALLFKLDSLSGINGVIRPGIVHRIDKDTSGLLVVAKNDMAHLSLSKQIENKTCHRTYLALVDGNIKEDSGKITTYIGRSQTDRKKMSVTTADKGRYAETDFFVVERFGNYTLCRFELHTGRTHQIRVHTKNIGHPIVGDEVYGSKKCKFNLNGQLLHAYKLCFTHPRTNKEVEFFAPIPNYFEKILSKLRNTQ